MIVVIDNYDSFTYNLVQYLGEMGEELQVFRNDKITPEQIEKLEQLRIIERGYKIKATITKLDSTPVDTPEDAERVREFMQQQTTMSVP